MEKRSHIRLRKDLVTANVHRAAFVRRGAEWQSIFSDIERGVIAEDEIRREPIGGYTQRNISQSGALPGAQIGKGKESACLAAIGR